MTKALESILGPPYIANTPYVSLMYSLLPFYSQWTVFRRAPWKSSVEMEESELEDKNSFPVFVKASLLPTETDQIQ